jgi:virginiamycin B lyase
VVERFRRQRHSELRSQERGEAFESFPSDKPDAAVRQLNGRVGEVWGAESATDRLVVIRTTGEN